MSDNPTRYDANPWPSPNPTPPEHRGHAGRRAAGSRSRADPASRPWRALAERGLATTVDEVAEAAGVSRRTVFRHFDTRENLFAQALRESLRSYGDRVGPSVGGTVPADGDLTAWWRTVLVSVHEANARNGHVYWELSALEPELTGELAAAAAGGARPASASPAS